MDHDNQQEKGEPKPETEDELVQFTRGLLMWMEDELGGLEERARIELAYFEESDPLIAVEIYCVELFTWWMTLIAILNKDKPALTEAIADHVLTVAIVNSWHKVRDIVPDDFSFDRFSEVLRNSAHARRRVVTGMAWRAPLGDGPVAKALAAIEQELARIEGDPSARLLDKKDRVATDRERDVITYRREHRPPLKSNGPIYRAVGCTPGEFYKWRNHDPKYPNGCPLDLEIRTVLSRPIPSNKLSGN